MAYRHKAQSGRTPGQAPQSLEAERAVLGAVLKSGEALTRVIEILQEPADFYSPKHQIMYRAALELYESAEPCDITTMSILLQKQGTLEKIGGRSYIVELAEEVVSTGNVAAYASTVLETGLLRRLITASTEIADSCYTQELPVESCSIRPRRISSSCRRADCGEVSRPSRS
jgi:replicative DNA helicase